MFNFQEFTKNLMDEKQISRKYSTVDDGINYRLIADTMTILGFEMNHSSARNNIVRVMEKFIRTIAERWNMNFTEDEIAEMFEANSIPCSLCFVFFCVCLRY